MKRWLIGAVLSAILFTSAGCGGDAKAPPPLSPEDEQQFEQERQKERGAEKRERSEGE
jgi:predicted small lipoprotein YifL